ncbi:MAG: hypothetical protein ACYC6X_01490 [Minisyncoccota bacterium]
MRSHFTLSLSLSLSITALALSIFLLSPLATQASFYPGQTTDPGCLPSDSTCIVSSIASSTANSIPYYASNGSVLSATSTFQILANGTASTTGGMLSNTTLIGTTTNSGTISGGTLSPSILIAPNIETIAPSGDTTGVTDTAAVAAAKTALGGKGTIVFGPGIYWLKDVPLTNNVQYRCAGNAINATSNVDNSAITTLALPAGGDAEFVMPSGATTLIGVGFAHCTLAGNRTSNATGFTTTSGNYIAVTGLTVTAGVVTATVAAVPAQIVAGTRILLQGTEDALMDSEFVVSSVTGTTILFQITPGFNGITIGTNPKFNTSTGVAPYNIGITITPILDTAAGTFAAAGGTLINLKGNPSAIGTLNDFFLDSVTLRDAAIGIDSDRGLNGTAYSGYWQRNAYFENDLIGQIVNEQPNIVDSYWQSDHIGMLGRLNDASFTGGIFTYDNYGIMPDIANAIGITFSHFAGVQWFYNYVAGGVFSSHNTFLNPTLAGASPSTDGKELIFVITGDDNTMIAPQLGDQQWGSQSPVKLSGVGVNINGFKFINGSILQSTTYGAAPIGWNASKLTSGANNLHVDGNYYRNSANASNSPFVSFLTSQINTSSVDGNTIQYTGTGTVLDGSAGHVAIELAHAADSSVSRNKFTIPIGTAVALIDTPGLGNKVENNEVAANDSRVTYLALMGGFWSPGQSYQGNSMPNLARTYNRAQTKARGTATITAGGTSVTVICNATALGGFLYLPPWYIGGGRSLFDPAQGGTAAQTLTAQSIKVTPTANMTAASRVWVGGPTFAVSGDLTTMSFTINTDAAVTAATTFAWEVDYANGAPN